MRTVKNVLDRIEGFHRLTGRAHRAEGTTPAVHRHARPLRDRAIAHLMLGTGLRRAEVVGLVLAQLDPADPAELRRVKRARLAGVRGKGRTTRTVFLGLDARTALADYLECERPTDADELSDALFLAAASIATRRPGGALSPRSINTIIGEIGQLHDLRSTTPNVSSTPCAPMICAIPSPIGSPRPPAITAPNSNAASATPTTAT